MATVDGVAFYWVNTVLIAIPTTYVAHDLNNHKHYTVIMSSKVNNYNI